MRFMGDLPEPVLFARSSLHGSALMQQAHGAVGREKSAQSPQHGGSAQVREQVVADKGTHPLGVHQA